MTVAITGAGCDEAISRVCSGLMIRVSCGRVSEIGRLSRRTFDVCRNLLVIDLYLWCTQRRAQAGKKWMPVLGQSGSASWHEMNGADKQRNEEMQQSS